MGEIVAAVGTCHTPYMFTRPPDENPEQLDQAGRGRFFRRSSFLPIQPVQPVLRRLFFSIDPRDAKLDKFGAQPIEV